MEVAGLDALETSIVQPESFWRRAWGRDVAQDGRHRDRVRGVAAGRVGWKPSYVLPGPIAVLGRLAEDSRRPSCGHAIAITLRRGAYGFAVAIVIGVTIGALVSPVRGPPGGHRVADHRAPDHALDRLVPARDPAVQAHRGGDHVRGRPRRRPVDRQRPDPRHRPHPAGAPPRRAGARRTRPRRVPPRDPAGGDAVVRRRAQERLGVRVAVADGRRAARRDRVHVVARVPAPGQPGAGRTPRACWRS